jgi:hypothetical protein
MKRCANEFGACSLTPRSLIVCLVSPPPTRSPTKRPTKAPVVACDGTSFWLYNPKTNKPIRKIANHTATCLTYPYNVEVRPCSAGRPVRVRLVEAGSGRVVHASKLQRQSPLLLFGPAATAGDVLPSPGSLPNGAYAISAKGAPGWGRLLFRQKCP